MAVSKRKKGSPARRKSTARPKRTKKAAAKRPAAKKTAKKIAKRTARKVIGEVDYAASRSFLKDKSGFVAKNKGRIPAMGKAAKAALDGPGGGALREAEATAAARSRDTF